MKFTQMPDGKFDVDGFRHAVEHVLITAQEILVDNSSYPTKEITAKRPWPTASWAWVTPTSVLLLMSRGHSLRFGSGPRLCRRRHVIDVW